MQTLWRSYLVFIVCLCGFFRGNCNLSWLNVYKKVMFKAYFLNSLTTVLITIQLHGSSTWRVRS